MLSHESDNILMVLQPRMIEPCLASIEALPIAKVWFEGYSEVELESILNRFIDATDYANYIIVSDDVIVQPLALQVVEQLLSAYETATGYCKCCVSSEALNITKRPVVAANGSHAVLSDYDFYTPHDLIDFPDVFDSWFAGWALTGMRRHLWLKYPFRVNPVTRCQSDYECCLRMNKDGLKFKCHKAAYVEHLKRDFNYSYVGESGYAKAKRVRTTYA